MSTTVGALAVDRRRHRTRAARLGCSLLDHLSGSRGSSLNQTDSTCWCNDTPDTSARGYGLQTSVTLDGGGDRRSADAAGARLLTGRFHFRREVSGMSVH